MFGKTFEEISVKQVADSFAPSLATLWGRSWMSWMPLGI